MLNSWNKQIVEMGVFGHLVIRWRTWLAYYGCQPLFHVRRPTKFTGKLETRRVSEWALQSQVWPLDGTGFFFHAVQRDAEGWVWWGDHWWFWQKLWYRISMDLGSKCFPKDAWKKWLLSSGEIAQTPQSPTSVNMKDQRVEQVPHFKYLRTKVDNPLTFQDNVNYIYTKRHSAYNNMMPASPWSTKCPNL